MNLQVKIRDLARKLDQLYLLALPPDDAVVEKLIIALDDQSIAALKVMLDEDTVAFKGVEESLEVAQKLVSAAVQELDKIHEAIASSIKVIQELDQLLQFAQTFK